MSYIRLGQIESLIASAGTLVGMGIQTGTGIYKQGKEIDAQTGLAREAAGAEAGLEELRQQFQNKQLSTQERLAYEREKTIKSVAIYATIGLVLAGVVIAFGVTAIAKKDSK